MRKDIYAVKADERDGAGYCVVLITRDRRKALRRVKDIRRNHSLGILRLAKMVRVPQYVVDAYSACGNTIE